MPEKPPLVRGFFIEYCPVSDYIYPTKSYNYQVLETH